MFTILSFYTNFPEKKKGIFYPQYRIEICLVGIFVLWYYLGMEDFKKKYILLSKVAKEKKYAQEYLGLLARRGDIGSIRIGKRWYTTWAWFNEFIETAQKKKEDAVQPTVSASVVEVQGVKKVEEKKNEEVKIDPMPVIAPGKMEEKVVAQKTEVALKKIELLTPVAAPKVEIEKKSEPKIERAFSPAPQVHINEPRISEWKPASRTKEQSFPLRENFSENRKVKIRNFQKAPARQPAQRIVLNRPVAPNQISINNSRISQPMVRRENIGLGAKRIIRKNSEAVPYREVEVRKNENIFSPDFSAVEEAASSFFQRFAYAASFAMIISLLAVSGYFVYTGNLLSNGVVAGASDERNENSASIMSQGEYFLNNIAGQVKQSVSIFRLTTEASKERAAEAEKAAEAETENKGI
ncbi:MAG: hypothetical protein PHF35_03130 [Candidatus Moranbacteria bacterium]|nr:hypothetical protein [Candidatus Moranbacteria bacterium]